MQKYRSKYEKYKKDNTVCAQCGHVLKFNRCLPMSDILGVASSLIRCCQAAIFAPSSEVNTAENVQWMQYRNKAVTDDQ